MRVSMMVPLKVGRSTIAAQRRGSVNVWVQPENDWLEAIVTEFFSSLSVRTWKSVATLDQMWAVFLSLSKCARDGSQLRDSRGRALILAATSAKRSGLWRFRLVPLGNYWRMSPLVFSFEPRCQGECGSQKYTEIVVSS